jgi:carbamoyltransferase
LNQVRNILGISAYYHDSAACLLQDGEIIAAVQEERFSRIKHDPSFPKDSVNYCLKYGEISPGDLDLIVFYEKPFLKFDRLIETYHSYAPAGLLSFVSAIPQWLKQKLHIPREIRKYVGESYQKNIVFPKHHESHAASAFFPSPFENAAILTLDGVGEWDTSTIGIGEGNKINILKTLKFPHSIGLLYSAFTYFAGFKVNSGEYKLMGLAPYGSPKYKNLILDNLLDLKPDGSFLMNMEYFNYCQGLTMTNQAFADLFDGPPRKSESQISEREVNLAASIQSVIEEIVMKMALHAKELTGKTSLCLSGGVALNCVSNGKLLKSGVFDRIWVQPASGDAGGALGAALFAHYHLLDGKRKANPTDSMQGAMLGPNFNDDEVQNFLSENSIPHHYYEKEEQLLEIVASAIADNKVIGWFQGRMEFGPRALGGRSIIGDARSEEMQSQMNLRIKFRESFRPFAPSVLEEDVNKYFQLNEESPYMLLVSSVQDELCLDLCERDENAMSDPDLLKRVNIKRSEIPAVTHVDLSARVQTVSESRNKKYYRLIRKFKELTGTSVIINTSFNIRGEPIVCSPEDAYRCFASTDMDMLVIENCILLKEEQPKESLESQENYLRSFKLD